jgi:hypothetical protein
MTKLTKKQVGEAYLATRKKPINWKFETILDKVLIFLHLKKRELGFTKLMYRGLPVILRDDFPANKIGFLNDKTGKMKVLDIKTGKVTKLEMPFYSNSFK